MKAKLSYISFRLDAVEPVNELRLDDAVEGNIEAQVCHKGRIAL